MGKQISPVAVAFISSRCEVGYCIDAVMLDNNFELEYHPLALIPDSQMSEDQVVRFVDSLNAARDRVIYRRVSV